MDGLSAPKTIWTTCVLQQAPQRMSGPHFLNVLIKTYLLPEPVQEPSSADPFAAPHDDVSREPPHKRPR